MFVRYVEPYGANSLYASALQSDEGVIVDTSRSSGNVSVSFWRYGSRQGRMEMRWVPATRDLFDLGAVLYIADEVMPRPERWDRRMAFHIPVAKEDAWRSHQVQLCEMLRFLTGDGYSFEWSTSGRAVSYGRHRVGVPRGQHDAVCLFSGGLDSLMGALQVLSEGRRVLLLGHYADGVASKAQRDLYQALRQRYGRAVDLIQCGISRSRRAFPLFELPPKVEGSHRSRSFLFLVLGVAIARAAGIDELILAENGHIALNPPLGRSRVGSLSTRTAHPRFLLDFDEFVGQIGAFGGRIHNPFLYSSKTDIVAEVEDWQVPLVQRSVSCAHATTTVRWDGVDRVRHCGHCVPCIYRRVALASVGLDHRGDYVDDVFGELDRLSPVRQEDMRMLVSFYRRVAAANGARLRSVVVAHGAFPAAACSRIGPFGTTDYGVWADMLSRWAENFLSELRGNAGRKTRAVLGLEGRKGRRA